MVIFMRHMYIYDCNSFIYQGCVYGRGVYFSTNASYSDTFAIPNEAKEKRMFYGRVLIGRSMSE